MTDNIENKPKGSFLLKTFNFNLDSSLETKKEIKDQLSTVNDRMEKIISHFQIDDFPVLQVILNMTHEKEILKGLSRAIDRIADLVEINDNLNSKLKIIEHAEKDPSWFASTFGDFTQNIDKDLQELLGDTNV